MNTISEEWRRLRRQEVAGAALWLDLHWPTEEIGKPWYHVVATSRLLLSDACRCVCGQLGAALAEHEGYEVVASCASAGHEIALVDDGGESYRATGYDLLADLDATCQAEVELAGILRKRMDYDDLPPDVYAAFSGSTPNAYWLEEIRARRGPR